MPSELEYLAQIEKNQKTTHWLLMQIMILIGVAIILGLFLYAYGESWKADDILDAALTFLRFMV